LLDAIGISTDEMPYDFNTLVVGAKNRIKYEVRFYHQVWVAHLDLETMGRTQEEKLSNGFRLLAEYFGLMTKTPKNEYQAPIPMTIPVLTGFRALQNGVEAVSWMEFILPSYLQVEHYKETADRKLPTVIPTPTDQRIKLLYKPVMRYAVTEFHGNSYQNDAMWYARQLAAIVVKEKMGFQVKNVEGNPALSATDITAGNTEFEFVTAVHNGPITPNILRHNEVMVPVYKPGEIIV